MSVSSHVFHQINNALHRKSSYDSLAWYQIDLPQEEGTTQFRCFQLCEEISFTKSLCQFKEPYLSKIEYQTNTTLLVFGLQGKNYMGFCPLKINNFIKPGDIWLINSRDNPLYRYSPAGHFNEMAVLKISTKRLKEFFFDNDNDEKFKAILENPIVRIAAQQQNENWISPLLENPLKTPFDRMKAEGKVLELIAHWLYPLACLASQNQHEKNREPDNQIDKARMILISELINPPTLAKIAKKVGMSHTQLNRCFKKTYGKTVFSWLRQYRLELAITYLADKHRNITDIAFQCGFSSTSHFIQLFRLQQGITPVVYRNRLFSKGVIHDD
ncbi:MAG: helix-turn-helix transcriptional regulator [Gammaproteobacteria bacterium]|nr:helix-turn-helix transcriptional regulator [Gammaproteobacteria bacterium]